MSEELIKVYGTRWCGDCYRAKWLLDRHEINYQWININQDSNAKDFVRQVNNSNLSVPTIVFADGSILTEPSNLELLTKLGLG